MRSESRRLQSILDSLCCWLKASVLAAVSTKSRIVLDEAQLRCLLVKFVSDWSREKQPHKPRRKKVLISATQVAVNQRTCFSANNNTCELSGFNAALHRLQRVVAPINYNLVRHLTACVSRYPEFLPFVH